MGWARGDSASGSCPARSEGIQRAIQTYHQRAPRAKQDTTTGRECFRGGSERHRTHGQQEAASNTGHPPCCGRVVGAAEEGEAARPKSGNAKKEYASILEALRRLEPSRTEKIHLTQTKKVLAPLLQADCWNPAPTPGRWSAVQRAGSCAAPRLQQGASLVFVLGGVSRAGRCADAVLSLVVARNGDGRAQHRKAAGC